MGPCRQWQFYVVPRCLLQSMKQSLPIQEDCTRSFTYLLLIMEFRLVRFMQRRHAKAHVCGLKVWLNLMEDHALEHSAHILDHYSWFIILLFRASSCVVTMTPCQCSQLPTLSYTGLDYGTVIHIDHTRYPHSGEDRYATLFICKTLSLAKS